MLVASTSTWLTHTLNSLPPAAVYSVLAALVFAETALFIGFVFPGETAVLVAGAAAGTGHVNIAVVCICSVVAAVLGSTVGFEIGERFGVRLLDLRILQKRRASFERALDSVEKRGAIYVVIGRFTAFLRAMMPALAGMSEMSWRRFQVANVSSALVWGVAFSLIGYYAGTALSHVEGDAAWAALGVLVVVIASVIVRHVLSKRREGARDAQWRAEHGEAQP